MNREWARIGPRKVRVHSRLLEIQLIDIEFCGYGLWEVPIFECGMAEREGRPRNLE
jgi:hypothetical protein